MLSHFTDLRKAANHPLLLRRFFDAEKLEPIAVHLHRRGEFGDECSLKQVMSELEGYNDAQINELCLEYPKLLNHAVPHEAYGESAKLEASRGGCVC